VKTKKESKKGWLSRLFDHYLENSREEVKNGTTKTYIWAFVVLIAIAMVGIVGFYQIPMEINIEGDFRGKFTNKTVQSLENKDLECIDEYYFVAGSWNWTALDEARMLDPDCAMFSSDGDTVYYRCPERNCEQRVVNRTVSDEFIPTTMQVTRISIKTGR